MIKHQKKNHHSMLTMKHKEKRLEYARQYQRIHHRYLHSEDIKFDDTGNGWTFVSVSAWKNSLNAAIVGMLIGPTAQKSLNSIEKIQPRMIVATFNGNPCTTIISSYSPTNVSEETELITFYN